MADADDASARDHWATGRIFQELCKASSYVTLPSDMAQLTCYQFLLVVGYQGRVPGMSREDFRERLSQWQQQVAARG